MLQSITINERRFTQYRRRPDFIQRFLAAWPQIAPLGFDTRFKRM